MCNCKKELEEKLTVRLKEMEPTATDHKVTLQGYAITVSGNRCATRPFMEYKTFANVPLKKGGTKPKKTSGNMFFSVFPFCGEKATQ